MKLSTRSGTTFQISKSDFYRVTEHVWMTQKSKNTNYIYTKIDRKVVWLHRFLLQPQPGQMVDHKNHDGTDNRRSNIRICSRGQNVANLKSTMAKSGYIGVHLKKYPTGNFSWVAKVRHGDKWYQKAGFRTAKEAALARDKMALQYFGEFAKLNFPKKTLTESDLTIKLEQANARILELESKLAEAIMDSPEHRELFKT